MLHKWHYNLSAMTSSFIKSIMTAHPYGYTHLLYLYTLCESLLFLFSRFLCGSTNNYVDVTSYIDMHWFLSSYSITDDITTGEKAKEEVLVFKLW